MSLFNTRLADVSAHIAHTTELLAANAEGEDSPRLRVHLERLGQRIVALDTAMILGALAGGSTCGAALSLFVGALRSGAAATGLFFLLRDCAHLHGRRADRVHRRQSACLARVAQGRPTAAHGRGKIERG